jgi:hypothetical protein
MPLYAKIAFATLALLASIVYAIWRENAQFAEEYNAARKRPVTINRGLAKHFQDWDLPQTPAHPKSH